MRTENIPFLKKLVECVCFTLEAFVLKGIIMYK